MVVAYWSTTNAYWCSSYEKYMYVFGNSRFVEQPTNLWFVPNTDDYVDLENT